MIYNRDKTLTYNEYRRVHYWLKYHFGRATKCEGENCKGLSKMFDWSLKNGCKYEKKRENFWQLCRGCHSLYDSTPEGRERLSKIAIKKGLRPIDYRWKISHAIECICPQCKKVFKTTIATGRRHCSMKCYGKYRSKIMKETGYAAGNPLLYKSLMVEPIYKTSPEQIEKIKADITNLPSLN